MRPENTTPFNHDLQQRIDNALLKREKIQLGRVHFDSKLLLAPLSGICNRPFRLLMENLGAGGTVSELVSCHGINYKNQNTIDMLKIDQREKNVGLQLFGDDAQAIALAAQTAATFNPKFIDINMGCPAKKVIKKGSGSALLKQNDEEIGKFLTTIKNVVSLPLSIKIRTGWNAQSINADRVIKIANECGIEFVAVHGRTQSQFYKGKADWELIEKLATESPLPIIGNGDLNAPVKIKKRLQETNCQALMLGRGPLRNPFLFLESLEGNENIQFVANDYWEVANRYYQYAAQTFTTEKAIKTHIKKMFVWFAAGFPGRAKIRTEIFTSTEIEQILDITRKFFTDLGETPKRIDHSEDFLMGGHG